MEITSRNPAELPPAMPVDITRPTREQIQEREPLTPPQVRRPEEPISAEQARAASALPEPDADGRRRVRDAAVQSEVSAREIDRARTEARENRATSTEARADSDAVEISARTRRVTEQALARLSADEPDARERGQRVEALKTAYERGELVTDERVERAAERMLAGE